MNMFMILHLKICLVLYYMMFYPCSYFLIWRYSGFLYVFTV